MKRFKVISGTVAPMDLDNYIERHLNNEENEGYDVSYLKVFEFGDFAPAFFVVLILEVNSEYQIASAMLEEGEADGKEKAE